MSRSIVAALSLCAGFLCTGVLAAQGTNHLIWAETTDSLLPARSNSKGIQQAANGDLYVLIQRGGTRELGIYQSTDLGTTWTRAGAAPGLPAQGSMVFDSTGTILNVLYSERTGTWPVVMFNQFDTTTATWVQPMPTVLFQGNHHFNADDIERTADDHLIVTAQTYQASPSQGIYFRTFDGMSWTPDPTVDLDGTKLDQTYTSGIHSAIVLDRSLPAAMSEALVFYRSGVGSYGRIVTSIDLGTLTTGPEVALSGQGGGFLESSADDRTANIQSVLRAPSGDVYMAFTANNSANSNPRVRMGHRDPMGTWSFYDVDSSSNYQHGNATFMDVAVGWVGADIAVYYGKNTYSGSTTAQNGSGVYRKIWDPMTMTFGPEVSLPVANQNGTFGILCTSSEPLMGVKELITYRDNTTDLDVYAYRELEPLFVRTVSSVATVVPGQTGVQVDVTVENGGPNMLDSLSGLLTFTTAGGTPVTPEYTVTPMMGNPTMIPPMSTVTISFLVDVGSIATTGLVDIDAEAAAVDTATMTPLVDGDADMTHRWDVLACGFTLCGDCNGDMSVSILDALFAAQIAASIQTPPAAGSLQFNACNVQGAVFPMPSANIDILDALGLAQAAAGLGMLTCC